MKKGFIAKGITLGCICCLLVALGACEKQETITKNATDNYVQTSGSVNDLKDLFYKKNNINEIKEDYSIKAIDGDVKTGVLVTSATKNGSLYYARPVNLDESEGAVISFELPYTDDYQTAGVEIQLVDIYDENNSITVKFGEYEYNSLWSVVSAKNTNFNSFTGYNMHDLSSGYSEYMLFPHNNFIGKEDDGNYHYSFNLCYDCEQNQVYLKLKDSDKRLVCDFDDTYFTDKNGAFKGFASNQVYVNIKFTELKKTGSILIESMGGQELSGKIDYTVPCDNIKIEGNGKQHFYVGAVGYNYTLPKPIETDLLMGKQEVAVLVKKVSDNTEISVDSTYSFVPSEAGAHKAIYKAKDIFGNNISKEIDFLVAEKPTDIDVVFEDKTYAIGDTGLLPMVTVSGGSGKTEHSVTYEYNGQSYDQVEEIVFNDINNLVVKVEVTDSIGYKVEKEQNYPIEKKALCYIEGAIPQAVRLGEKLTFPSLFAFDYVNNEEMTKAIYINGNLIESNDWIVQETDGTELLVEYYANEGKDNEYILTNVIKIFNQEESYFLYDKELLIEEIADEYTSFKVRNTVAEFTVSYPYALACDLLNINLLLGGHSKYSHIDVKLSDYMNGISVTYRLKHEAGGVIIAIKDKFGEFSTEKLVTNYLERTGLANLYYSNEDCALLNYSYNEIIKIDYADDGSVFKGFKNGGVYVEFMAESVKTDAELRIAALSNQRFYTRYLNAGDKTTPEFAFQGAVVFGEKALGEILTLPKTQTFDVLTGEISSATVSVYGPSGVVLDKVELNSAINLELNEYGTWTVVFEGGDSFKNFAYREETIVVKDDIPPTITADDFIVKGNEVKVGDTIEIPEMRATDNLEGGEVLCYVLSCDSNMQYRVVKDGKITFDKKGIWTIIYYAKDATGNISTKEFRVEVK